MRRIWIILTASIFSVLNSSCEKEELVFSQGDLKIEIETGEHWMHDLPLFLGINKKNAPQFAVWLEDTNGNYLTTIFATYKIATEGWQANKGNRRKEALPHWCYQRGIIYEDGLMLPTKNNPLIDGITGATPTSNKTIQVSINEFAEPLVIKAEFNHSVDFNTYFPEDAKAGDDNYSGGEMGSGQPAIVYSAIIYPYAAYTELKLSGYSSSDGNDGLLRTDMDKLTSAKSIVKRISINRL